MLFEYHVHRHWNGDMGLEAVLLLMEHLGYSCYYDGKPTLTKLTDGCWLPAYEFRLWSNVVRACVRAGLSPYPLALLCGNNRRRASFF